MPADLAVYAAIGLMALVTFATRTLGAAIMARVGSSPRITAFLDALSASVLAAIVANALAQGGLREAAAVGLAALVMFGTRSAVGAMLCAMAAAALWTALGG